MSTYTTKQGDMWDIICYRLFPDVGKEMCMDKLIEANPEEINRAVFPAGVVLRVPEISVSVVNDLPPWKK
ncbi:tail protein X [Cloacibacillus porcorum]|uniref:tail protein X n=1 Tax=Cloacibacillus porcorum TaxID=1197717 RepID=UPI002672957C|nr:tail protein X [Cloacibacillus porcorum]